MPFDTIDDQGQRLAMHSAKVGAVSRRRQRPGETERIDAARRFLEGVRRGDDPAQLVADAYRQHPRNNTFPGEVYLALGADVLTVAGCTATEPVAQHGLVATWLPEVCYRGRDNAKIRYAVLACAARAGGLEVDLLDEVTWWGTDDYYDYAACAALALIRAAADRLQVSVGEVAQQLANRSDTALSADDGPVLP